MTQTRTTQISGMFSNLMKSFVPQLVPAPLSDGDTQGGIDDEMPDHSEVRMVATRPIAAGESLEMQENSTNAERLCKYGFVDINRRHERNPFRFEVRYIRKSYYRRTGWEGALLSLCLSIMKHTSGRG